MRVLTTAVLVFEWIVLALAIPVAVNVSGVAADTAWMAFGIVSLLIIASLGLMRGPAGVWLGWAAQVTALVCGLFVPMLVIVGVMFAGLYFAAIRLGSRVDAIRAAREQQVDGRSETSTGTMDSPGAVAPAAAEGP